MGGRSVRPEGIPPSLPFEPRHPLFPSRKPSFYSNNARSQPICQTRSPPTRPPLNFVLFLFFRQVTLACSREAYLQGVCAPKGILLSGVPGTGKTMLARVRVHEIEQSYSLMGVDSIIASGVTERTQLRHPRAGIYSIRVNGHVRLCKDARPKINSPSPSDSRTLVSCC